MSERETRLYCPTHETPVEFVPEIEGYTCNDCPKVLSRGELISEDLLLQRKDSREVRPSKQPPMGEFL